MIISGLSPGVIKVEDVIGFIMVAGSGVSGPLPGVKVVEDVVSS